MAPVIQGDRTFSGNTVGNGNVFVQGSVHVNSPAEGSQRRGENETLHRLYKSPYRDRKDRNPPRVPGTCDWFVSHEHFQTWNESNSSAMLWVSADPGCGKSVLVRYLIDSVVQTTESRTVCYFFFKDDFSDQKNVTSALSCILRQIFIQRPSLLSDEILKKFNSGGETFNTSFSELWQIFMQVAADKDAGEIVCLLDAIDECEDQSGQGRSELLKALCTLYGTRRGFNLKFLLTSRPYVDIHRSLQPLQIPGLPVIHLSGESEDEIKKISQEINTYIDARVQDVGKRLQLSKDECDLLLQKLMQVPNRTYLWVYLILNFIENSINVSKIMILEATLNIPTTVDEAYERILSKSFDTRQARKALHIIVAASRPLTLREMNFALALDEGHKSYNDLGLLPDDRFRETLRNICGLCVVIVDSKVYLLHQTVKEFLIKEDAIRVVGSDRGDHEWKRSLDPQESHRILAEICIWHLLAGFKMRFGSPARHAWCEIFLDYSAKHWALHFRQIPIEIQSMMTESTLLICDVDPSFCKEWFSIYWTTTNTKFPEGFTTLMMTSYFGLNFAVSNLLNIADIELDTQDSTYRRTALSWAARNGWRTVSKLLLKGVHLKLGAIKLPFRKGAQADLQDIFGRTSLTYAVWNEDVTLVQMLIKAGAQANLEDELEGTPLSYAFCNGNVHIIDLLAKTKRRADIENDINRLLLSAARKGHEEVMSLLLKTNRANIEAQDLNDRTALVIAADGNHWEIVKLLVEAGASANAQNLNGRTALIIAADGNHWEIVKLLVEAGASANAQNPDGQTPLIRASQNGHEAVVKWLIKAGADVNAQDEYSRTALICASWSNHEAIVKRLIEAGVDVNALDKNRRTALIEASWNNHEAIVKQLIEAGADMNAQDENVRTALIYASWSGHEAIVKRLIEAGADVNAQDEYGRTALIYASWSNHEAIVKRLIEAGADVNV